MKQQFTAAAVAAALMTALATLLALNGCDQPGSDDETPDYTAPLVVTNKPVSQPNTGEGGGAPQAATGISGTLKPVNMDGTISYHGSVGSMTNGVLTLSLPTQMPDIYLGAVFTAPTQQLETETVAPLPRASTPTTTTITPAAHQAFWVMGFDVYESYIKIGRLLAMETGTGGVPSVITFAYSKEPVTVEGAIATGTDSAVGNFQTGSGWNYLKLAWSQLTRISPPSEISWFYVANEDN